MAARAHAEAGVAIKCELSWLLRPLIMRGLDPRIHQTKAFS
jgi:hypothetical protein